MKEKAGMPTRYSVAKEAIDYAIDHSKTLKEFQFALKEMGYAYNLSPSRKYWTVTPKGYDKPIRLKNLGADYTNDRIVERIKEIVTDGQRLSRSKGRLINQDSTVCRPEDRS